MITIYKAKFPNGKCYIGLTRNSLCQRKSEHKSRMKDKKYKNLPLYNALRKYGFQTVAWEVLIKVKTIGEAEKREMQMILENPLNYNVAAGGMTMSFTPEICKKIAESQKGVPKTNIQKKRISK
ncbi:MAG: GIY-YIG nuclease family protein, partial [bacterium]